MRVLLLSLFTLTSYLLSAQFVTIYHCDIPPTDSLPCLNNSLNSHYLKPVITKKPGNKTDTLWSADIYASLQFTNYSPEKPIEFILYQHVYPRKEVKIDSVILFKQKNRDFIWHKFTIKEEGLYWIRAYINGSPISQMAVRLEKTKQ